ALLPSDSSPFPYTTLFRSLLVDARPRQLLVLGAQATLGQHGAIAKDHAQRRAQFVCGHVEELDLGGVHLPKARDIDIERCGRAREQPRQEVLDRAASSLERADE